MSNWYQFGLMRKVAIVLATALIFGVFIADATALSEINSFKSAPGSVRGACGWTMFVAIVSLLTLPLMLTPSMRIQRIFNRTGIELCILGLLTLFYFISGITLATKSNSHACLTNKLCSRVRATTALSWLTFFVLLVAMTAVAMIARVQSRLGMPIFSAYSFDVEGQEGRPYDMHNVGGASQYGSHFGNVHQQPITSDKPYGEVAVPQATASGYPSYGGNGGSTYLN
ncbi:hypothetical protein GGI15_002879 [Coemansia interrupta]|uniref:MARVEL domain-containing protein n=1 Tax=Coemansia interrupta TaxID=1126814 RepID=A0A9W8HFR6_9FUNG|nr:hypothetical protein GGI15_002879 [Coemansia interrupta]